MYLNISVTSQILKPHVFKLTRSNDHTKVTTIQKLLFPENKVTHLRNWKVEYFFKVGWKTSEERVEAPVVAEVCYD